MPKTNSKARDLAVQYINGKSMKEIMSENPNVPRASVYHNVKKLQAGESSSSQVSKTIEMVPKANKITVIDDEQPDFSDFNIEFIAKQPDETPKPIIETPKPIIETPKPVSNIKIPDAFLQGFQKKNVQTGKKEMSWEKEDRINRLFGNVLSKPEYDPSKLASVEEPKRDNSILSKISRMVKNPPKPKTKRELDKEEFEEHENERLKSVQKIRMYLNTFEDLHDLHIIPKQKNGEPDIDKYMISLYTKKQEELDKLEHFIVFHVRNNMTSKTSSKIAHHTFETLCRVLEFTLSKVGVHAQGLTDDIMNDEDVDRCLKEILIESELYKLSYGPKSDLLIKLGMKILEKDSKNRIENKLLNKVDDAKGSHTSKIKRMKATYSEDLANKYKEL